MRFKLFILLILFLLPELAFAATAKLEKHVSLINITRTTNQTSYQSTADREPIFFYDADAYDNVTAIYAEAVMRAGTAGDTAYMTLSTLANVNVTGAEVTTTSTTNVNVRSGDIKANLTDSGEYRARWKCDNGAGGAPAGTCAFDQFRLIIVQQGLITKTETVIEIAEDNNVPSSATWADPADHYIFEYDADQYDGTVNVFLEADLHENSSGNTVQARLFDITGGTHVSGSEVKDTGDTTTDRIRSSAFSLTDGRQYKAQTFASSTSDDLVAVKIVIQQTGSPSKTESYLSMLNTLSSGTATAYDDQNRELQWDTSNWAGDSTTYNWSSTLKVTANTGYSQLFKRADGGEISTVTTTATSYTLVSNAGISLPAGDGNILDHQRKIDTSGTVSVARAFIVARVSWSAAAAGEAAKQEIIWFD